MKDIICAPGSLWEWITPREDPRLPDDNLTVLVLDYRIRKSSDHPYEEEVLTRIMSTNSAGEMWICETSHMEPVIRDPSHANYRIVRIA